LSPTDTHTSGKADVTCSQPNQQGAWV
jgi:hypothetical protein